MPSSFVGCRRRVFEECWRRESAGRGRDPGELALVSRRQDLNAGKGATHDSAKANISPGWSRPFHSLFIYQMPYKPAVQLFEIAAPAYHALDGERVSISSLAAGSALPKDEIVN